MTYSITQTQNWNEVIHEILGNSRVSGRLKRFFWSLLKMNAAGGGLREKALNMIESDEEAKEIFVNFYDRIKRKLEEAKSINRIYDRKGDLI